MVTTPGGCPFPGIDLPGTCRRHARDGSGGGQGPQDRSRAGLGGGNPPPCVHGAVAGASTQACGTQASGPLAERATRVAYHRPSGAVARTLGRLWPRGEGSPGEPWWWPRRSAGTPRGARTRCPGGSRAAFAELGPTYVKVGQVIASSPGLFPPELDRRVRLAARPGAAVPRRRGPPHRRGGPRPAPAVAPSPPSTTSRSRPPRSPRSTRPRCSTAGGSSSRSSARGWRSRCGTTCGPCSSCASVLERIPQTAIGSPRALAEDFARTLHEEMDFRLEADNMERMRSILDRAGITDARVPEVHWDLVGRRVLTMERIDGFRFTRRRGHAGRRHRHRPPPAHRRPDRGRGRAGPRLLPRRPPRRQHRRPARRHVRALRLRHRRPADRVGARPAWPSTSSPSTTNDYPAMVRALRSFGSVPRRRRRRRHGRRGPGALRAVRADGRGRGPARRPDGDDDPLDGALPGAHPP